MPTGAFVDRGFFDVGARGTAMLVNSGPTRIFTRRHRRRGRDCCQVIWICGERPVPRMPRPPGPGMDLTGATQIPDLLRRAMSLHNHGDISQAAIGYRRVLDLAPNHFDATHLLAVVYAQDGNLNAARDLFASALRLRPGHAEVHFNRGTMEKSVGEFEAAIADFDIAINTVPNHAGALNNRSLTLQQMRRFEDAISDSDRLIEINPDDPVIWNNRGTLLLDALRLDEALDCVDRAIRLRPDYSEALNNRGNILKELHRFDEALSDYNDAIALDPDFAEPYFNKSILLLLLGDYEEGWRLWEWRWKQRRLTSPKRDFAQPQWTGDSDIAGKCILLHSEQGLGDTVQFIRYAPLVAERGARVIVEAPARLHPLIRTVDGIDKVVGKDETLPSFDFHCPMMSPPLAFNTTVATIPAPTAYIEASSRRIEVWLQRLGSSSKPRVALAWRGNPNNTNDHNRSARLADIERRLSDEYEWICLHSDLREPETAIAARIGHLRAPLDGDTTLEDAAALCALCDLVVTVDTSFAHIAGAMGKAVHVMLPFTPDHRWMMERQDTPWYPSMTLHRQDEDRDWDRVMGQVVSGLGKRL